MKKYLKTIFMSAGNLTNRGIRFLLLVYLLKIIYIIPMLFLWKNLVSNGVKTGMTLDQLLLYTFLGALLSDILNVKTQASNWLYEGIFISLYQRPYNVIIQLVCQTIGGWIPQILIIIIPSIIISYFLGINYTIVSLWFIPCIILCIVLGFAVDLLFACLTIRMKNASWVVYVIRTSLIGFLSGAVIPFSVLPWHIGTVLQYIPFGSLAAAPLSVMTGTSDPFFILSMQIFWIVVLWFLALLFFKKSEERLVSYGG
jgi:ABC-2 type transport system permease protein